MFAWLLIVLDCAILQYLNLLGIWLGAYILTLGFGEWWMCNGLMKMFPVQENNQFTFNLTKYSHYLKKNRIVL